MRRWAPLAAALSVIAVVVAVGLVAGRSPAGDPPTLRLASGSDAGTTMAADAPMATSGKRAAGGSSFELVGSLPNGPDEARAQTLPRGAADVEDVRRLAAALGVDGAARRVEHAWQVGILRVEDAAGHPWSMYAGCGPDQPTAPDQPAGADGAVSICAGTAVAVPGAVSSGSSGSASSGSARSGSGSASTPSTTTVAPPPAPAPAMSACPANARCAKPTLITPVLPPPPTLPATDTAAARRAARAVLDQLGMADADLVVDGGEHDAFVRADPRIAGLRTWGYPTYLEIDVADHVVSGSGFLGRPSAGASYPLVSAKSAFDSLPVLPRPMMLCPATSDCPQPVPSKVTGAELGLQLTALADEQAALLPTWLFNIEGWPQPLAQPAIEPRFLQLPKPEPVDPGLIDPVPPAEPPQQTDPSGPRSAFGFDSVFPTDEPNVVIVQYGDSGSCPHTNVEPLVKESTDSVVVTLEADAQPNRACTDDYRQQLVTLKLQAPLDDRTVIDGSRGQPVAVDRTCARPMGQPTARKACRG